MQRRGKIRHHRSRRLVDGIRVSALNPRVNPRVLRTLRVYLGTPGCPQRKPHGVREPRRASPQESDVLVRFSRFNASVSSVTIGKGTTQQRSPALQHGRVIRVAALSCPEVYSKGPRSRRGRRDDGDAVHHPPVRAPLEREIAR